jgi:hypothetical protein
MAEEKIVYDVKDIQERYGVGVNKARNIMQSIRAFCRDLPTGTVSVPGAIGYGKVLYTELYAWEQSFLTRGTAK